MLIPTSGCNHEKLRTTSGCLLKRVFANHRWLLTQVVPGFLNVGICIDDLGKRLVPLSFCIKGLTSTPNLLLRCFKNRAVFMAYTIVLAWNEAVRCAPWVLLAPFVPGLHHLSPSFVSNLHHLSPSCSICLQPTLFVSNMHHLYPTFTICP